MNNNDIIILGSSGQAKEIVDILNENIRNGFSWNIIGYIATEKGNLGDEIDYLGSDDYLLNYEKEVNVVIAIGDGKIRKEITNKLIDKHNITFPNIISNNTSISENVDFGIGNIIQQGVIISTGVKFGDFNLVNLGSSISHESELRNFSTICPGVHIAGNVKVEDNVFIGIGTSIIQGIQVGTHSLIGAGTTIIHNVDDNVVVVGCPGKVIKRNI